VTLCGPPPRVFGIFQVEKSLSPPLQTDREINFGQQNFGSTNFPNDGGHGDGVSTTGSPQSMLPPLSKLSQQGYDVIIGTRILLRMGQHPYEHSPSMHGSCSTGGLVTHTIFTGSTGLIGLGGSHTVGFAGNVPFTGLWAR